MNAAVEVSDVSKKFRIYHERNQTLKSAIMRGRRSVHEDFWALKDVSFDIPEASTFALVGDNGSGKSTLLKCMAQILYPSSGSITANGRIAALLEVGSGFHPELSGRDNVYLNASILGMSRPEIDRKFDEIVDFSGVEEFIDQPVKNYSSGMYVRLGFSVAINVDPEILLVDEVLAVGDAAFQTKCGEKFAEFRREGRTVVVVSHSMPQLRNMSDQAAWLEHGQLKEVGSANVVLEKYLDSTRSDIRVSEDGRVRWGSGEAMVERVEVLDGNGAPFPDVVPTGSTVVLRLHYDARQRIDDPVFGFAMEAQDGTYMWGNNTRDLGFPIDRIEGRGVIDLTIPAIPLAIGGFVVHGSVVDSTTEHVFDYVRDAARIYIGRGVPFESGGYITMGGTWSFPTAGSVRA
ncbi:ABC transporter ATP-binding protein [Georgenia muralis]|uniref:ABC-2 type transport system ATP-binding protein n=1 Tax=Georgenia muralis TaxID=154117 RepID=A0A3N5A205_9MICO|nr:ABC transporter ATP-binding protein [Georgenia muralis]RPF25911.1 ABC-2 type transport system ATP-binding protein [Georgenia muralis]